MIKKITTVAPSSDAYGAGDALGTGYFTVPGVFGPSRQNVILDYILVQDLTTDTPDMTFMFFDAATTSTLTDNSAFAIGADDLAKCIAAVSVTAVVDCVDCDVKYKNDLGLPLYTPNPGLTTNDDNNLYFMVIVQGSSPVDWNDKTALPVVFGFK